MANPPDTKLIINDPSTESTCLQPQLDHDRFFDLSLDLLAVANFEGYFLRVNPAWEETLGFTAAELMAQPYLDLVHPEDRSTTRSAAQGLSQGAVAIQFENRYRTKDGSYRWLLWSARPYDEQNLVYAVAHDITDRKQAEEALRQSEEFNRRILDSSPDCIKVLNLDGEILYMNTGGQCLMQIDDITSFLHSPWLSFWDGDDRLQAEQALANTINGEVALFYGYCPTAKGQPKWWEVALSPMLDASQQVKQVMAISRDVTDRKQTEQKLRESEERLKAGVQVAGVGLARFDYATDQVELSPEAAALYGFSATTSTVSRAQIHATFHPDERAELEVIIAQVLDPQGTGWFAKDHRVVWPNGEVRCLSVRKQVFFEYSDPVDHPSYAILAAIDITERRQIQAELESHNRELDSFVHIVSHDLKAPLRGIANLSQWIEDDLEGSLLPDTQSQMALLRSRVDRMATTIDGLLDYARVGHAADATELVSVAELLAETIDSLAPPTTFTIVISPDLPTLKTNRLLLSQVFSNLISNSIKHHDRPDGKIHISCEECGDSYQFTVADDGPGIAPQHHDSIFVIFQAVNRQISPDSTGIGLSIVRKIVEATGGNIQLESEIGKGATFCFTWPQRS
jgi:PAS domain S-box-containing protein